MHSLSKGYYNQKSFVSSSIFGSVPHLLGRPVGHVHVDDGGENGEDGAVGDHGTGGHLRSVAPHTPLHTLVINWATSEGCKGPGGLFSLQWCCDTVGLCSGHGREIPQESCSRNNFGWDAHSHKYWG